MRNFKITVNGVVYNVTVEENTSAQPTALVNTPVANTAPIPQAQPVPQPTPVAQPAPAEPVAPVAAHAASAVAGSGDPVKAPMPGTVVKICVKPGDTVKNGDVLCVIEAMKMENEIVSPRDAAVTSVTVAQGASVNAGETLLTIE